jgi:thiamine-phosphate pyrophosphorylase
MIPKLHYISQATSPKEHLENIQNACSSGAELIQLRFKDVSDKKFFKVAEEAREIPSPFQSRVRINGDYKIARAVKADGVFLEKTDSCPIKARIHLYTWQSIGGIANGLQDCETLLEKQVDYISLGPFRCIATKDRIPPILGVHGYTAIIDALQTKTPIIGFGGIATDDVTDILKTGISGIAVSGVITRDFNTIQTFHQLLKASSTQEQRHTFK